MSFQIDSFKSLGVRALRKLSFLSAQIANSLDNTKLNPAILDWKDVHGDVTLRLAYPLSPNSVVYDVGGFKGQWTSDIYSKYRPRIYVFEPMPSFYTQIQKRFEANNDIVVLPFGLADKTFEAMLSNSGDASSVHFGKDSSLTKVRLYNIIA